MNKKAHTLFAVSIFMNILFIFFYTVSILSPSMKSSSTQSTTVANSDSSAAANMQEYTSEVSVQSSDSESLYEDSEPVVSEETSSLEPGYKHFTVDGVNFEIAYEYTLTKGHLDAKDAAICAMKEYKRVFKDEPLNDTFYASYSIGYGPADPPTWYFYTKNDMGKYHFYPKTFIVHAISGEMIKMVIPLQNPIYNATSSKVPWISNLTLIQIKRSLQWINISKSFLTNTVLAERKINLSNVTAYWDLMSFGLIYVTYDLETADIVTPVIVYIDIKTQKPIGYSFQNTYLDEKYAMPISEDVWETYPELQ